MKKELTSQFSESYDNVIEKLEGWLNAIITNLPNFIIAVLVFALSYFLSGLIRKNLNKFLKRYVDQASVRSLISTIVAIVIVMGGLLIALGVMNLDTVLKSMLAGAGVMGLAIGLALQSSLSNTFSGIYLSLQDIINIGDWVETNGYQGTVHEVNLRNTVIKEPDNNLVMIPNKMIVENPFKNFGLTERIRVILLCGVGYECDLQEVEDIAKKAIEKDFPQDESEKIEFHYKEFGDSSINFQLRFWVDAKVKITILEARSEAIKILKRAFDEHGINIPFPIRTLQIHSDDKEDIMKLKTSNNSDNNNDRSNQK